MTEKLYDANSHLKEFLATVLSCEENGENFIVTLDRTAFFPEGGGQSSDKGFIDDANVLDVQLSCGVIFHTVDRPLTVGEKVKGKLNWERRFDFMQQHSAEHIVSGVAHKLYGCENVGFHLSEDIVTLDFDKPLSREEILKIEALANKAVFRNRAFNTYYPDSTTLSSLPYRSKKALEGAVRIVEIEDTDICACCAPHVKFAGEIGLIKLLGAERLRSGVRLQLKAGGRALADYTCKYENVLKISSALCVKQEETAAAVDRFIESTEELKIRITDLKRKLIAEKGNTFEPESFVTAEFENDFGIKELQIYADALYKKCGGIRAVLSPTEEGYLFAICAEPSLLDKFFAEFKNCFSVKGGGRNGMVQGTVFSHKAQILGFFKNQKTI